MRQNHAFIMMTISMLQKFTTQMKFYINVLMIDENEKNMKIHEGNKYQKDAYFSMNDTGIVG